MCQLLWIAQFRRFPEVNFERYDDRDRVLRPFLCDYNVSMAHSVEILSGCFSLLRQDICADPAVGEGRFSSSHFHLYFHSRLFNVQNFKYRPGPSRVTVSVVWQLHRFVTIACSFSGRFSLSVGAIRPRLAMLVNVGKSAGGLSSSAANTLGVVLL